MGSLCQPASLRRCGPARSDTDPMDLVLPGVCPLLEGATYSGDDPNSLTIDATLLTFASPFDLAGIVAVAYWAASGSLAVTLVMPRKASTASYLQRMDVVRRMPQRTRVLGLRTPDDRADLSERLLEVTHLTPENASDVGDRLGRLVRSFYKDFSPAAGRVVARACGELIDNAVEHGIGNAGAFVAAQTHTGATTTGPRLEFAVCDAGVGVKEHLRRNPRHPHFTTDKVALSAALEAGVSGVADDRGNGLSDLIKDTSRHGTVTFRIRSGKGEVRVAGNQNQCPQTLHDRDDETGGTWAWLAHERPSVQ